MPGFATFRQRRSQRQPERRLRNASPATRQNSRPFLPKRLDSRFSPLAPRPSSLSSMSSFAWIDDELDRLEAAGLRRRLVTRRGPQGGTIIVEPDDPDL